MRADSGGGTSPRSRDDRPKRPSGCNAILILNAHLMAKWVGNGPPCHLSRNHCFADSGGFHSGDGSSKLHGKHGGYQKIILLGISEGPALGLSKSWGIR